MPSPLRCAAVVVLTSALALPAAAAPASPRVAIETAAGTIVVALEPARAPVTVKNFLAYVDAHRYDGATFYRAFGAAAGLAVPAGGVIQGGLRDAGGKRAPIPVEPTTTTGLHNADGAISMARTADPNSATSEFFICVGDDRFLDADRFSDHAGYAVFGRVVRGMDVVLRIQRSPENGELLDPPIRIVRARRL